MATLGSLQTLTKYAAVVGCCEIGTARWPCVINVSTHRRTVSGVSEKGSGRPLRARPELSSPALEEEEEEEEEDEEDEDEDESDGNDDEDKDDVEDEDASEATDAEIPSTPTRCAAAACARIREPRTAAATIGNSLREKSTPAPGLTPRTRPVRDGEELGPEEAREAAARDARTSATRSTILAPNDRATKRPRWKPSETSRCLSEGPRRRTERRGATEGAKEGVRSGVVGDGTCGSWKMTPNFQWCC